MASHFLRIGTRGSPLALWQAHATRDALAQAHGVEPERIHIEIIRTTGDKVKDRLLADVGGKGLFTKEIEEALADGRVDVAVHSAKDVPTFLPPGLVLSAALPRAEVRDALIAPRHGTLAALPQGAVVGTASARREALLRRMRPDLKIVLLRGNVETRLRKVEAGEMDATLLAYAGLSRLGLTAHATDVLAVEAFPPAPGQGVVALETHADDARVQGLLAAINDAGAFQALLCERAMLTVLDGSCRTPIGGWTRAGGGRMHLAGIVIAPDGSDAWEADDDAAAEEAEALGRRVGEELLKMVPEGVLKV